MDLIHKKGSYNVQERRFPEGESEGEGINYFALGDQDKILNEEKEIRETKRKKRKKKKVKINAEMDYHEHEREYDNPPSPGDQNQEKEIPLDDLRSKTTTGHNNRSMCKNSLQEAMDSVQFTQNIAPTSDQLKDVRHIALQQAINRSKSGNTDKKWHTDYVLVHKTGDHNHSNNKLREMFEAVLEEEGIKIERKYTAMQSFVILHCPFERLCIEAEFVALEMPLAGVLIVVFNQITLYM